MKSKLNRKTIFLSFITFLVVVMVVFIGTQVTKPSKSQQVDITRTLKSTKEYLTKKGYEHSDIKGIDVDFHYYPEFKIPIAFVEFKDEIGVFYIYFEYDNTFKQQPLLETSEEYRQKKGVKYTTEIEVKSFKHYEYQDV